MLSWDSSRCAFCARVAVEVGGMVGFLARIPQKLPIDIDVTS